ncbi:hypothetical protein [Halorubellus litoreus]|uniref:Uncharacterized protein n=1 Tax=Halorubellus litoreus TaxID=755308 RepID=A0ABD5VI18_9EURY
MTITEILDAPNGEHQLTFINGHTHEGLQTVVFRVRDSHYVGYVKAPDALIEAYPAPADDGVYDVRSLESMVDVHGGLTYGPDEDGWVGFDCAHSGDMCVDENGTPLPNNIEADLRAAMNDYDRKEWATDWWPEDVVEECDRLAEALNELALKVR